MPFFKTFCSLNRHLRRITLLVINVLFNHDFVFRIIGRLNRRFDFLKSVFLCYPASQEYAAAYVYPSHQKRVSWAPYIAGIIVQDRKWTLKFAISNTEEDFFKSANRANLAMLVERMEEMRILLGASQKTFAGILPGVLYAKRLIRETVETDVTIEAIIRAEEAVRKAEGIEHLPPLIILGGLGFIGRRLVKRLQGREIYCVDIARRGRKANEWPDHLAGKPAILINVTRKAALSEYLHKFWPELILLNEVYPEPSGGEIERLTRIGSPVHHIVGLQGKAYPSFPGAYHSGIPCCAGRMTENMEAIVKRLN